MLGRRGVIFLAEIQIELVVETSDDPDKAPITRVLQLSIGPSSTILDLKKIEEEKKKAATQSN